MNAFNYTTYLQTIHGRYHGEQKTMTTPWPVHTTITIHKTF